MAELRARVDQTQASYKPLPALITIRFQYLGVFRYCLALIICPTSSNQFAELILIALRDS